MERKRYLELCRENAIHPKSAIVVFEGGKYYPYKRVAWFDKGGELRVSGELIDAKSGTVVLAPLDKIKEVKK